MRPSLATTVILAASGCLSPAWADGPAEKNSKPAGPYNKAVVAFCQRQLGKKVGSGECVHLANEALRVAGAEFLNEKFGDHPNRGDFVWGALVKRLSWDGAKVVDSSPKAQCQPGDILQFRDVTYSTSGNAPHHTAIVASVDANGLPTALYEQNTGGKREVTKSAIDFTKLNGGWVRIYRPSRPNRGRRTEFTLLNHTDKAVSFTFAGKQYTIDKYDSGDGFKTWWFSGTVTLVVGRMTIVPKHRQAYEIYPVKNEQVGLREVK